MPLRIIVQSCLVPNGLVLKLPETATADDIRAAVFDAIPEALRAKELEVFDEVDDDDVDTLHHDDGGERQRGRVLHVGRCRRVDVVVRYAGRAAERRFAPVTRIGRIRNWAVHQLGINPADANELVLQVAGSDLQPSRDKHVGCFVEEGTCAASFDLVRAYTINGDASVHPGLARLLADLEGPAFVAGEFDGRWRLQEVAWPNLLVDVFARDGRRFALRLNCEGYPNVAPTGAFWDSQRGSWLAADRWPRAGSRFGAALRTDWQGGTALYIPCDRLSINGHEQWLQLHPAWVWDTVVGVTRYLDVVWTLINGADYVAPAA